MKHFRLLVLIVIAVVSSQSTRAALFRVSQVIGYDTGSLGADGATGQQDQWSLVASAGSITVTNGSGSLNGTSLGLVASAGDKVFIGTTDTINASRNQFVPNGTFPQGTETNIYYSFLYKFKNAADVAAGGEAMVRVNRANSGTGTPQHWDLWARSSGGQIQLGIAKAGGVTNYAASKINVGDTFFVVVRQHIIPGAQNDVYDLWINPPPQSFGANELSVPPPAASIGAQPEDGTEDQSGTGPGRFALGSGLNAEFDEFRIGPSWAEATPPFGQCVSAGFASQPASVSQSAEISATFKVEPLGTSPTFQWQRSAGGGAPWQSIPGATAASYTTPSLLLSETGSQYRVIASVTCNNSSSTSAVATVTLTAPVETRGGLVLHDTFLDPDLGFDDRANSPVTSSNSVWYTSATDNLTAFGQAGNMLATPVTGSSSLWLGYFTNTNEPPVHLGIGRALKITLPFTPNSFNAFTNNSGLRIGLFDYFDGATRIIEDGPVAGGSRGNGRNVRGYMLNLDFGPTFGVNSPLQLLARTFLEDDNLMGSIGSYASLGSGPTGGGLQGTPAFQSGKPYILEFTVSRVGLSQVDLTAMITGGGTNWSVTVTDTNYVYRRFDSVAIRPNSLETSADSFTFSEFRVEVTEAASPTAPFKITALKLDAASGVKLSWDSQSGVTYHVLSTPFLSPVNWTTNSTIIATGPSTSYAVSTISGNQRYYRVLATR